MGVKPRVDTYGQRKTAHVFGALSLDKAAFHYAFADVFNGHTFHQFLVALVDIYAPQKIFLILDNGPCHWLDKADKEWLNQSPISSARRSEIWAIARARNDSTVSSGSTSRKLSVGNRGAPWAEGYGRDAGPVRSQ